jgi:hypothetical protein
MVSRYPLLPQKISVDVTPGMVDDMIDCKVTTRRLGGLIAWIEQLLPSQVKENRLAPVCKVNIITSILVAERQSNNARTEILSSLRISIILLHNLNAQSIQTLR